MDTALKNNIKHALQQPVWQESIVIKYKKKPHSEKLNYAPL